MFGEIKDNKDDIDEEYKEEDSHLNGNDYIQARVRSLMPGQGHKQEDSHFNGNDYIQVRVRLLTPGQGH